MTPAACGSAKASKNPPDGPDVPFGSNAVRLSPREWLVALGLVAAALYLVPIGWQCVERFQPEADYRMPFRLGEDYWMFNRYSDRACSEGQTLVLGDSVVWGHYVAKEETLSHYLNRRAGREQFANLGIDGIHPAAMAGLVETYGRDIAAKRVVLHCNLLWMSSKRHDLQTRKEFAFNHPRLVPQFFPSIPCYTEPFDVRLGIVIGRRLPFQGWTNHVQAAYFKNNSLQAWTLEHPRRNPAGAVTLELPSPDEPPSPVPVAEPWTEKRIRPFNPAWVELETSFQWESFRRTVEILRRRGNRVFVLVGPFNEHMLTDTSRGVYQARKREVEAWLRQNDVPHRIPPPLPSHLYADASHPLADGYRMLADELFETKTFADFLSAE